MKRGSLKLGDVRSDGFVFRNYKVDKGEAWLSPEMYHRFKVGCTLNKAKHRAKAKCVPFEIDKKYLLSIFPDDGMCPALNVPMVWGEGLMNSPSLDRRIPELGYVEGNVAFISNKANTIKSNATTEEIFAVANYLKG